MTAYPFFRLSIHPCWPNSLAVISARTSAILSMDLWFVIFLTPWREMKNYYLDWAKTAPCQILRKSYFSPCHKTSKASLRDVQNNSHKYYKRICCFSTQLSLNPAAPQCGLWMVWRTYPNQIPVSIASFQHVKEFDVFLTVHYSVDV